MIVYVLFVHKKSVPMRKVYYYHKKLKKKKKTIFSGFFRWVFWVGFLGGFLIANPVSRGRLMVCESQGVTKRCRLSLLTNNTLVYESQCGGMGVGCGVSSNDYSCEHHVTWSPNKLWRSTSIFNLWWALSVPVLSRLVSVPPYKYCKSWGTMSNCDVPYPTCWRTRWKRMQVHCTIVFGMAKNPLPRHRHLYSKKIWVLHS